MIKIMFYDLETTGLNYLEHGIHQLSGYIVTDGHIMESFNFKTQIVSGKKIDQQALDLQSLTPEILAGYPTATVTFNEFRNLLKKYVDNFNRTDKLYLCGFNNARFDDAFLRQWFSDNGDKYFGSYFWSHPLDVLVLATQKLMDVREKMPDFKLMTVAKQVGIVIDESKLHDAMYDIDLTKQIYDKITENKNE